MAGDLLSDLTLITNFICMAIALWFAAYLLARSSSNPLTFRAVIALLALGFYYNNAFTDMVHFNSDTGPVRSLTSLIALIAGYDLTYYLLPVLQQKKQLWVERGVILLGGIAIILLFSAPSASDCDPRFTCPTNISYPWAAVDFIKILFFLAFLYNLWQIRKTETRLQNVAFYTALLLGISTIAYSLLGTILNQNLPRFIPNTVMLTAMGLLLYSVARDQTFISRRSSQYDLLITFLTITGIVAVYVISAVQIGLDAAGVLILVVLAIFTHSAYDMVREFIDRTLRAQEGQIRQELREMARDTSSENSVPRFLKRGLAILCHNLRASNGLIAVHQKDSFQVMASLHCLPVGSQFSDDEIPQELVTGSEVNLLGYKLWLSPAFFGPELMLVVGIGGRKDQTPYGLDDLYWLDDIAEEIGRMVNTYMQKAGGHDSLVEEILHSTNTLRESLDHADADELLSTLAYKPDPDLIKCIEESLRNLNDYSKLGNSSLVSMLSIEAQDHIECGKLVQNRLTEVIDKLRPEGDLPREPLPREWHAYIILHDAYVENRLARDIMSKLYISEGTYYRVRRHALRGVARAMLEMSVVA